MKHAAGRVYESTKPRVARPGYSLGCSFCPVLDFCLPKRCMDIPA